MLITSHFVKVKFVDSLCIQKILHVFISLLMIDEFI
jgi:hypothetical protein